ncbi:ABC transporter ATP-binding protein [Candidatus Spyradosoma sp. SGI.093]|uniref:ABC transporter ATP-binding protein n=1 Tax=Candidatus Spyradosoma sp. SGI.093 TaxID=3420583 RepID=UPI003D01A55C
MASSDTVPAVEISRLTKDFRIGVRGVKLRAVDDVSFSVAPGEIFGLLGPNGSGKSTTLKIMLGLFRPTSGTCRLFGRESTDAAARRDVGFLPEAPYFYGWLSGRELVRFYAKLAGVPAKRLDAAVEEALEITGMTAAASRRVKTYSKGMLQRIGVAQAIVHDPRLVILDEPTAGIDPIGSAEIGECILGMKRRGKTVLLCSHLLGQVENICDRIAIMDKGRLVVAGTLDAVLTRRDRTTLTLSGAEGLSEADFAELRAFLRSRGAEIESVAHPRMSLEKFFVSNFSKENRRS